MLTKRHKADEQLTLRATHRAVFAQVRQAGTASRAAIARATGLSSPAVGAIAADLLQAGLLEEGDAVDGESLGRPSRPLQLERRRPAVVAVQIGVRHTRLAALPVAGPTASTWDVAFKTPGSAGAFSRRLADAVETLGVRDAVVGVSAPGVVDEGTGESLLCPNLRWLTGQNVMGLVGEAFGRRARVCVVQEIRALAMGELWAAPARKDFLLVDIGEGVGGAVVVGGQLYQPPLAMSGELGHVPVLGNKRACGCGATGCLETLVSRSGLVASSGLRDWPTLVEQLHGVGGALPAWLSGTLDATAAAIAGALNIVGVREVVVTGALGELPATVHEHLAAGVARSAMWARFGTVTCEAAPRRRAAGLVAAAVERILLNVEQAKAGV